MRHLKAGRKLGRTSAHRKALFRNMTTSLIVKERIRTTVAKAKELRSHVEKTITLGKKGTLHARRLALRNIHGKEAFTKLFDTLSERYASRNGGYTRILRVGNRRGDDAPMAIIELVDREDEQAQAAPAKEKKGKGKKESAGKAAEKKETGEKKEAKEKKEPAAKKEEKAAPKKKAASKDAPSEGKTAAKKSTKKTSSSKKKSDDKE